MINLGTLGGDYSFAYGINNSGQIVGSSYTADNTVVPFIYHKGVMTDLNDLLPKNSNWRLYDATKINDAGQIIGFGSFNGVVRMYLLTPDKAKKHNGPQNRHGKELIMHHSHD